MLTRVDNFNHKLDKILSKYLLYKYKIQKPAKFFIPENLTKGTARDFFYDCGNYPNNLLLNSAVLKLKYQIVYILF